MRRLTAIIFVAVALLGACRSAPDPVSPPDAQYDEAKQLRSEIAQFDLAQHARTQHSAGEAAFAAGETAYEAGEYAAATESFEAAIESYRAVVQEGFRALSASKRDRAAGERARAEEAKANVAVADQFNEAVMIYDQAAAAAAAGDTKRAAELYDNAAVLFGRSHDAAVEKRRQAETALARADGSLKDLDAQRQALEDEAREDLADFEDLPADEGGNN